MDDDARALDKGWEPLPEYGKGSGDAEEAVTVSISTAPSEWLVNTNDSVVVPMSMVEVVEALQSHKLNEQSLVWRNGMQEWQPVDRVPQLKLAARLPSVTPVPAPAPSRPAPPKSLRATTAPQGTPRVSISPARDSQPRQAISEPRESLSPPPSRGHRPTLPSFPGPAPAAAATPSRPRATRPPIPRPAVPPPPATADDTGVIAVYERPAATISFELGAPETVRSEPPSTLAAHSLAPTTTDNVPRRNADLSVVAASHFREVQRSSQRLIWISSLGSAAAASLLTLWLSSGSPPAQGAASTATTSSSELARLEPPPAPSPTVAPAPTPEVAAPAPAPSSESKASKPKAKRRARAVPHVAPVTATTAATQDPSAEPNPYDVKLEDDSPKPASNDGAASDAAEGKTTSSATPGF